MNILVSGARGTIGSVLVPFLRAHGDQVIRLVRGQRQPGPEEINWDPESGYLDVGRLDGVDAVVHLAGETISGRWTAAKKALIRDSRVRGTRLLCETLARARRRPEVLVCASAVGYYGDRGNEALTEESAPGNNFLAGVCREWEAATEEAARAGIRVVNLRIGMMLSAQGGGLPPLLLLFRMGLGGRMGNGKQFVSWIALDDLLSVILFALTEHTLRGPVNAVSPNPITNAEFTRTLGRVLRRPAIFPLPAAVARLALGQMAEELLLASLRVLPERLIATGYQFQYLQLEGALRHVLRREASP